MCKSGVLAATVIMLAAGTTSASAMNQAAAAEYLICDVEEVRGLSEPQSKKFGIENGSTKGTDNGYSIKIELDGDTLHYTNLDNNASMRMSRLSGDADTDVYRYSHYLFSLKDDHSRFEFQMNTTSFNAIYSGNCLGAGSGARG